MEVLVADDKLRNEILSDAEAKAQRILKKAEKDAAAAAAGLEEQTEQYEEKLKADHAKFLSDAEHRVFAAVDIESKKAQIQYVGEVIDSVFETVRQDILTGKLMKYETFILNLIRQACEQLDCGKYTVLIGEREQNPLSSKDIQTVKPKSGKITSVGVKQNSDGYIILSDDGKRQIFVSLSDYMTRLQAEKRMEIFSMLNK